MMGYRSTLLRSIVVLTLFYSSIGTIAFYAMGPATLTNWLDERGLYDQAEKGVIPVTQAASAATEVVVLQFREVMPYVGAGIGASTLAVLFVVVMARTRRESRGKQSRNHTWRGITASITEVPTVKRPRSDLLDIKFPRSMPKEHKPLARALLGYIQANNHAYVGDGHNTTLLKHTVSVIKKALSLEGADPLLVLAAAAHDIGKVETFQKIGGKWESIGHHDKAGARLLSSFPTWWALPEPDKYVLLYAVKYEHSHKGLPTTVPGLDADARERLMTLVTQLKQIDSSATKAEKEEVIEAAEKESSLLSLFMKAAPEFCYQTAGLGKGLRAVGWRQGTRLYFIEWGVRKAMEPMLTKNQAAALETDYEQGQRLARFSSELYKQLDEKGWLVTEHEIEQEDGTMKRVKASKKLPLWKIETRHHNDTKAGRTFSWVFIVDLPEEERGWFPANSQYAITVKKAEREQGAPKRKPTQRRKKSHSQPEPTPQPAMEVPVAEDEGGVQLLADDNSGQAKDTQQENGKAPPREAESKGDEPKEKGHSKRKKRPSAIQEAPATKAEYDSIVFGPSD